MKYTQHTSLALVLATLALFSMSSVASADSRGSEQERSKGIERALENVLKIKKEKSEVSINSNGSVTLQSATVTAVSGSQITASTTLGTSVLTWTITTDAATQFLNKTNKVVSSSEVAVGDSVNVRGVLVSGSTFAVKATSVRDLTKVVAPQPTSSVQQIFEGTLSVLPGSSAPTTLTIQIGGASQVVALTPTTVILNKAWTSAPLTSFASGDVVRVFGYIPAGSSSVTAIVLRNATR